MASDSELRVAFDAAAARCVWWEGFSYYESSEQLVIQHTPATHLHIAVFCTVCADALTSDVTLMPLHELMKID